LPLALQWPWPRVENGGNKGIMKLLKQFLGSVSSNMISPRRCSFKNIVGHDHAKAVLKMAVEAVQPVHILLVGPMGIGKTELMLDVEQYVGKRNSHFSIGSRMSKAGIGDLLFKEDLEYLFIDEMETMTRKDQAVLLSVQQHGIVSETLYKKKREKKVSVRVIATSNDTRKIMPALLTRFHIVKMNCYTEQEFINISKVILKPYPNIDEEKAVLIATLIYNRVFQPNHRHVIQVARLSQGDDDKIYKLIEGMVN
jgi:MoxR-like ATPase